MIIPSIDLMGGRAVQLRQGRELVLTSERDPVELAIEFNRYGEVAVIDLDAALGCGDNLQLVKRLCRVADVRAGGGIRSVERGRELLRAGACRIIVGTAAEPSMLGAFPPERVIVALDHRSGEVLEHGWTKGTGESVLERADRLASSCAAFLITFVENEGGMGGMDAGEVSGLQKRIPRPITVAGGVRTAEEASALSRLGVDVQVGMALYTGDLDLAEAVVGSIDWSRTPLPAIVQDEAGQVLMLAFETEDSLRRALREGKGIYFSRSRGEIWEKGASSGHTQRLVSCRCDCDGDSLLFTVRQEGRACHAGSYSCFGARRFSLEHLFSVLGNRRHTMPSGSVSAEMFADRRKLLKKIMEEAYEVTTAGTHEDRVWEMADVLYFLGVLAVAEDIRWRDIVSELGGRNR